MFVVYAGDRFAFAMAGLSCRALREKAPPGTQIKARTRLRRDSGGQGWGVGLQDIRISHLSKLVVGGYPRGARLFSGVIGGYPPGAKLFWRVVGGYPRGVWLFFRMIGGYPRGARQRNRAAGGYPPAVRQANFLVGGYPPTVKVHRFAG